MAKHKVAQAGTHFNLGETMACPTCGVLHKYGDDAYLAAHWNDELSWKCVCGTEMHFRSGTVLKAKAKRHGKKQKA